MRGTKGQSLVDRLVEIHRGVAEVIASMNPDVMALEQLYSHIAHPRTSILMGHARGVICLAAAQAGIPVVHYPATQIKRILTGNGRASKEQMQQAIQRELRLASTPEPPDVADALAVAVCHYYLGRGEQESADADELPNKTRQKAAEASAVEPCVDCPAEVLRLHVAANPQADGKFGRTSPAMPSPALHSTDS